MPKFKYASHSSDNFLGIKYTSESKKKDLVRGLVNNEYDIK